MPHPGFAKACPKGGLGAPDSHLIAQTRVDGLSDSFDTKSFDTKVSQCALRAAPSGRHGVWRISLDVRRF